MLAQQKARYQADPERHMASQKTPEARAKKNARLKERRRADPAWAAKQAERTARVRERDPEFNRRQKLRMRGITLDEFDRLLMDRGGGCAICSAEMIHAIPKHRLHNIDHAHRDEKTSARHDRESVRGILCQNCNAGIGQFHDNPDELRRAVDYLRGALAARPGHCTVCGVDDANAPGKDGKLGADAITGAPLCLRCSAGIGSLRRGRI